jgi:hypothetical protein
MGLYGKLKANKNCVVSCGQNTTKVELEKATVKNRK